VTGARNSQARFTFDSFKHQERIRKLTVPAQIQTLIDFASSRARINLQASSITAVCRPASPDHQSHRRRRPQNLCAHTERFRFQHRYQHRE
jgi:hypothetical protein